MRLAVLTVLALVAALGAGAWAQGSDADILIACDRAAGASADKTLPAGVTGVAADRIDPAVAVPACEAAAKANPHNARIVFELGRAYSAAKQFEAARAEYEKADQLGSVLATNNLAALYSSGRGGPKDDARAAQLLKKAADAGFAMSASTLGGFYQNGRGGLPKDDREAARLYKIAADQGFAPAQSSLGYFYEAGRGGLPKDDRAAARLYSLAADQGNAYAQNNLGLFNLNGRGGLPKDDREAARLYKLSADQGNASGRVNLGYLYETGRGGLAKDDAEAARLYRLAADQKNAFGQNSLGVFTEYGRGGIAKDDREAARLYKLAADQGNSRGQTNLGRLYENGRGGLPKDPTEAARLFRLAAGQGYAPAQSSLAWLTENGLGGIAKDEREAVRLYKLAADQGNSQAQNNLGVFYQGGRGGLAKDEGEAARLYKLAADQGNAHAQDNLGWFYLNGRGGLPKDEREGVRLIRLAVDRGMRHAMGHLAFVYENGRGGVARDPREAARLRKLAEGSGNASGQKPPDPVGKDQVAAPLAGRALAASPVEPALAAAPPASTAQPPVLPESPSPQAISKERRVALVIGNAAYQAVPALRNTTSDAKGVAAVLKANGFSSVRMVSEATRDSLIGALRDFQREADTADWAVVYYAGHGMEVGGTNYLVPTDAKLRDDRDVQDEAVPISRVLDAVNGARKLRLVMLDACRDNPFLQKMRRSVSTRGVTRGLAAVEPVGATLVVFAAKDGETALDGTGDHSPFTESLIKRMQEPGIEINRVFRLVTGDVLKATRNGQRPFVYGSLPGEDEYFFKLR